MIKELFQPDLLLIKSKGKLEDQNDFFAALYHTQESWAARLVPRREPLPSNFGFRGKYTPERNSGSIKTHNIPDNKWVEFQNFIDDAYEIAGFIDIWRLNLSAADFAAYLVSAGILAKVSSLTTLRATNGTILATELTTPALYEAAWNSLRVPYERSTLGDSDFPYIRYIETLVAVGDTTRDYFRRSTLKFDGTA